MECVGHARHRSFPPAGRTDDGPYARLAPPMDARGVLSGDLLAGRPARFA